MNHCKKYFREAGRTFSADVGVRANINSGVKATLPNPSFAIPSKYPIFVVKSAAMTATIQLNNSEDFKLLEPLLRLIRESGKFISHRK